MEGAAAGLEIQKDYAAGAAEISERVIKEAFKVSEVKAMAYLSFLVRLRTDRSTIA